MRAQESIRLGFVLPIVRQTPAVVAFFEELSLNGFVEGKNITIVAGSFGLEHDSAAERAAAVIKGAPDLIVAGGPLTSAPLRMQRRRFRSLRSQMTWSARASRLRLLGRAAIDRRDYSCAGARWQTTRLANRCGAQRTSDGSTCRHTYYDISATSGAPRRDAAARDRANAVCHRQT